MKDLFFLFTSSQLRHVLELRLHPQKQDIPDTQSQEERKPSEITQNQKVSKENLK